MASVASSLYARWGSVPFKGNVEMAKGDTRRLVVTLLDDDGAAVDITGYSFAYAAALVDTENPDLSKSSDDGIAITTAASGVLTVTLDAADTSTLCPGSYYHEIEATDGSGNVSTVLTGRLKLREDAA
jgi:hypothetical protein